MKLTLTTIPGSYLYLKEDNIIVGLLNLLFHDDKLFISNLTTDDKYISLLLDAAIKVAKEMDYCLVQIESLGLKEEYLSYGFVVKSLEDETTLYEKELCEFVYKY